MKNESLKNVMGENKILKKDIFSIGKVKYKIYNPGGNITALVNGSDYTANQKKLINKMIMENNSQVEQVGFLNNKINRLEMAGGEFCINATRCAIYEYSKEKKDKIEISVSGTNKNLIGTAIYNYYNNKDEKIEIIQQSEYSISIELDTKEQYIKKAIITGIVEEV